MTSTGSETMVAQEARSEAHEAYDGPEASKVRAVWTLVRDEAQRLERRDGSSFLLLTEPLMLLRFLRARDLDVEAAAAMWHDSAAFRCAKVPRALHEMGAFEDGNGWSWRFHDQAPTVRGTLGCRHGHARRAPFLSKDGEPVLIWRLGRLDVSGIVREGIADVVAMAQVAHLEDALQACRRDDAYVRARCVADLTGLRISAVVPNIKHVKRMLSLTKYYAEVTKSVTFVNAPFGFQTVWDLVSLLLNDHMRSKVKILGTDFRAALAQHACIDPEKLPKSLGGQASDSIMAPCLPVPKNITLPTDAPFLDD
ncbi:hypothetical protein CTAYLR_010778 [Chrysophaeum taylorii]|uniref:CRAL-TRIO domain-containing protein n=1 Tax=Chrysophaeum taylorii TaxID=2483200 RepID=A0AAD7U7L7_9STRA|nr:hypothetical protein CTAYLR_010778 [Chrysophaeum taylorii]